MYGRSCAFAAVLLGCLLLAACGGDDPAGPGGPPTYVTSDLAGTWDFDSLASGPGEPWWERARATCAASGRLTASTRDSDGGTDAITADFAVSTGGTVTMAGSSTMRGHLSRHHNLLLLTDTWAGAPSAGTTELKVGVKMGTGYALSDLEGTWRLNAIASGPGAPWWSRGTLTIAADGMFAFATAENDGSSHTGSSFFDLDASGQGTSTLVSGALWSLDATRSLFVTTATWTSVNPGTTELIVMVKAPTTCTLAQLAGRWECSALATGPGAPRWTRTTLTLDAAGHYEGTTTDSGGAPAAATSGDIAVAAGGLVTRTGSPEFLGYVDASRTVLVATDTWSGAAAGTTELQIWTRLD